MTYHAVETDEEAKAVAKLARKVFGFFIGIFVQSRPKWAYSARNDAGQIVGGVILKRLGPKVGLIDYIFVSKAGRGQGLGPELLNRGLAAIEETGCKQQLALVRDDNTPSWNMFATRGFNKPNILRAYFGYGIQTFFYFSLILFANHGYSVWAKETGTTETPKAATPGMGFLAIVATCLAVVSIMALDVGVSAILPFALPMVLGVTMTRFVLTWPLARTYGPIRFQVPHGGIPLSLVLASFGVWWPVLGLWVPREPLWHESKFRKANGLASFVGWLTTIAAVGLTYIAAPNPELAVAWRASLVPMLFYQAIPIGPFEGLDGFRVLRWSKAAFVVGVLLSAAVFVFGIVQG